MTTAVTEKPPSQTVDDAVAAFDAVLSDYTRHARAARELATEHLRAETLLGKLLNEL